MLSRKPSHVLLHSSRSFSSGCSGCSYTVEGEVWDEVYMSNRGASSINHRAAAAHECLITGCVV